MVCSKLPPANQLSDEKVEKLMCSKSQGFETFPDETQKLKEDFLNCKSTPEAPVIVFISKMFPVSSPLTLNIFFIIPYNRIFALH
jgi:ribosome assembly protein 1